MGYNYIYIEYYEAPFHILDWRRVFKMNSVASNYHPKTGNTMYLVAEVCGSFTWLRSKITEY